MTHYLIEFRFQGKAKKEIKSLIYEIDNRFHLGVTKLKRPIPHITLVGPIQTNNEKRLVKDFKNICSNTQFSFFKIRGYGYFSQSNVVFINIEPSKRLDNFRWELSRSLSSYCELRPFDYERKYYFHATLVMKLENSIFNVIKNYIDGLSPPSYKHFLIRVTLLKNAKILYEYDFLQRRLLTRSEALDKNVYLKSINLLREFFKGEYDPDKKIKSKIFTGKMVKSKGNLFIQRLTSFFKQFFRVKYQLSP